MDGNGTEGRISIPGNTGIFFFVVKSRPDLGLSHLSSPGGKRPNTEREHSVPSSSVPTPIVCVKLDLHSYTPHNIVLRQSDNFTCYKNKKYLLSCLYLRVFTTVHHWIALLSANKYILLVNLIVLG